jgi:hypothetical protein
MDYRLHSSTLYPCLWPCIWTTHIYTWQALHMDYSVAEHCKKFDALGTLKGPAAMKQMYRFVNVYSKRVCWLGKVDIHV